MDKANAVLAGLAARAKSVGIHGDPLEELDQIAVAFDAADRLARSFYVAASTNIPAPAPRPTELDLIDAGARAVVSMHESDNATRTLTDQHVPHVFEAVGATPAEKAAITRGAHVASDVSARWSKDIAEVVTKVRSTLGVANG
jgi:hypothetical protein